MSMLITITKKYNRREKAYDLLDAGTGEIIDTVVGKRESFQRMIQLMSQAVYSLALEFASFPPLESRTWKAAEIVVNGGVDVVSDTMALVDTGAEHGAYVVQKVDDIWECDCIDFTEGTAIQCTDWQIRCKHILAVEIETARRDDLVDAAEMYGLVTA